MSNRVYKVRSNMAGDKNENFTHTTEYTDKGVADARTHVLNEYWKGEIEHTTIAFEYVEEDGKRVLKEVGDA